MPEYPPINDRPAFAPDTPPPKDTSHSSTIDVDYFINHYGVDNPLTIEALRTFPTLCYLLGETTPDPVTEDNRPDNVMRPIYYLTDGSGMFGLKNREDAMRWKGIFNHILGTARQVHFLAEKLSQATPEQKEAFAAKGFDASSFEAANPNQLTAFMLISHAGRRQMDEATWHNLSDTAHPTKDSYENTVRHLTASKAPQFFVDLMRVENHDHLFSYKENGMLPDIVDNILTYCDWTYGQNPQTLESRFTGLRTSQRTDNEALDKFEQYGKRFETAVKEILGEDVIREMPKSQYSWEEHIRRAYCAPSGISLTETFPSYADQFGIKN